MIYFDFLFMKLSQSHDLSCSLKVWLANPIDSSFFFLFFFNFILQLHIDYELTFMIYFGFLSMKLS
jgi:hypothetical protein